MKSAIKHAHIFSHRMPGTNIRISFSALILLMFLLTINYYTIMTSLKLKGAVNILQPPMQGKEKEKRESTVRLNMNYRSGAEIFFGRHTKLSPGSET